MELATRDLIKQMNKLFAGLEEKYKNLTPVLNTVAEIIDSAIDENFRQYGRYDSSSPTIDLFSGGNSRWKPLSDKTKAIYKKKGITPLVRTLKRTADMYNSISVTPQGTNTISIRMSSPYGEAQNYGFRGKVNVKAHLRKIKSGKKKKEIQVKAHTRNVNIPASPFLTLTDEDILEIVEFIEGQLL